MEKKAKSIPRRTQIAARLVLGAPGSVQSALISDHVFAESFGLPIRRKIHFGGMISIDANAFARALKVVSAGSKNVKLELDGGEAIRFKGTLGRDGSVTLVAEGITISERYAGVMSPIRSTRLSALRRMQKSSLLPIKRVQFWEHVLKERSLKEVELLEFLDESRSTPDFWSEKLSTKRKLSIDVLMPSNLAYYRNLLPEPTLGETFDDYLRGKVAEERSYQLSTNVLVALNRWSVSALSQSLVQHHLLQELQPAELETILQRDDPFSLLFAFEASAHLAAKDEAFIEVGSRALEKLFGDSETLRRRSNVFCGCTVLSVVGLRRFAEVRSAPLYWRRMLAFAHAGVLTNSLIESLGSAEGFNSWVLEQHGQAYFWNSLVERRLAPRWWPEWIAPSSIETELVGRAFFVLDAMSPSDRPKKWIDVIQGLTRDQSDKRTYVQMFFSGPIDDFQFDQGQHDPANFSETLASLKAGQPLDQVKGFIPFVHMARLSQQHVNLLTASLQNTSEPDSVELIPIYVNSLKAAAGAAAANRALPLAETVVEKSLKVFQRVDRQYQEILIHTIVDSANAILDGTKHMSWLASLFERLAYQCASMHEAEVISGAIAWLSQTDPKYGICLSRARAIIDLYQKREVRLNQRLVHSGE